jgi:hypothetical protein
MRRRRVLPAILVRLVVSGAMIAGVTLLAKPGGSNESYLERYKRLNTALTEINRALESVQVR